jgi:hypothetical protein
LVTRKNKSVQQELHNGNWILYLRKRVHITEHIEEFVSLWIRIQAVHLQLGVRDSIIWRWTASGSYSTRSAYRIQFKGSYGIFNSKLIWKAQAENKCKVFAWILVQEKILTAENLQKRGWPHQDHCVLCDGPLETCLHLSPLCPFAKVVWTQILTWEHFDTQLTQFNQDPAHLRTWWEETLLNGLVIYTCWNLWKERNRRIFNNA